MNILQNTLNIIQQTQKIASHTSTINRSTSTHNWEQQKDSAIKFDFRVTFINSLNYEFLEKALTRRSAVI